MKSLFVGSFLLVAAASSMAQTAYVIGNGTRFGTLNLQTGAYTKIADLTTSLRGIATGADGTLYGLAGDFDQFLYKVSSTGTETLVGATGTSLANGSNDGFGVAYDGSLYLRQGSKLYSVNATTGAATLVGSMGVGASGQFAGTPNGKLYTIVSAGSESLYELNRSSGAATFVGSAASRGALVYANSTMFSINGSDAGGPSLGPYTIYSVNTATGASTAITNYDTSKAGIISSAATIGAVPEPTTLAALTVGGLGLVRRRFFRR